MKLRKLLFVILLGTSFSFVNAQQKASPADVAKANIKGTDLTINYSKPSAKGREIFGGLVPLDKVWRTGANEATTFEVSKDVKVNGKDLKAGKYSLFTIPGEKEWTIIFDSKLGQWGAYAYNSDSDVLRIKAKSETTSDFTETFTINADDKGSVTLAWEKTKVSFTVK